MQIKNRISLIIKPHFVFKKLYTVKRKKKCKILYHPSAYYYYTFKGQQQHYSLSWRKGHFWMYFFEIFFFVCSHLKNNRFLPISAYRRLQFSGFSDVGDTDRRLSLTKLRLWSSDVNRPRSDVGDRNVDAPLHRCSMLGDGISRSSIWDWGGAGCGAGALYRRPPSGSCCNQPQYMTR